MGARIILLFLWMLTASVFAQEQTGVLVVSYHTGPVGERLDRIRFRLIDDKQQQRLYPQGANYACDTLNPNRIVVIDDLAPGEYTVEFLVPNADGLFADVNKKTLTLHAGERVKIDSYFHPRYASLKASADTRPGAPPFVVLPLITLEDHLHQVRAQSANGELSVKNLIPGCYTLIFEDMTGYTTPCPIPVTVKPGECAGLLKGVYDCDLNMQGPLDVNSTSMHQCFTRCLSDMMLLFSTPLYAAGDTSSGGYGQISIRSNLPIGRWIIYRNDLSIYQGVGNESGIPVSPGSNYRLRIEELDGFKATSTPPENFKVDAGRTVTVFVKYEKTFGIMDVRASMIKGGSLKVSIDSKTPNLKSFEATMQAKNGKVEWSSPLLPTGMYTVKFTPSAPYITPPAQNVQVFADKHALVTPEFVLPKSLKVTTGFNEAAFTLSEEKGAAQWKGNGREFVFKDLLPGLYTLTFSSPNAEQWKAPGEQQVSISRYQDSNVKVAYTKLGKLTIQTNAAGGSLLLTPLDNKDGIIRQDIHAGTQIISLPEGAYQADFQLPAEIKTKAATSQQILIRSGKNESLQLFVEKSALPHPAAAQRLLLPPPSKTSEMVYLPVEGGESILGDFHGDGGPAELPPRVIEIAPFSISAYQVTNAQYAHWLNQAWAAGKITFQLAGEQIGIVNDAQGHPLCKTIQADSNSLLTAAADAAARIVFSALPDMANHPVVDVSWYGAAAFCKENDCRLPTEAEWEKAAGMALAKPLTPLKKFRYGFSRDTIDRTWANYNYGERPDFGDLSRTTEVGFYNGIHLLPATSKTADVQATHKAVSPIGAYDMSGNVWEWTSDWYAAAYAADMALVDPKGPAAGSEKVLKGGSYGSSAVEVRVAARRALAPDQMDAATGFRVAK